MNRLKELREEAGWKQSDLADRLGVQQQAISKYERQIVDLDTGTIRRLCALFDCTADYLLGMSARRSAQLSDEDAALVAAYHAADDDARAIVDLALKPYFAETKIPEAAG
ncbi:MAG: helix-turn-helix transcriptional regulator [Clostridia bacterium]|nr:helix-turn-helix transcriptional regulator [Clostridia bacterium]